MYELCPTGEGQCDTNVAVVREREERKKEVAALWRAVKRLSLGQSVVLPRGADAIDVTAPDVNEELFPDQRDDQPDADNILQQILEGEIDPPDFSGMVAADEIDPPDFSGMVAADDSLEVSWPPMNIPGKAGPLPTGNDDGLDGGVPQAEGGAPQAVGGTPGAPGGAPQAEGGMPQAGGGAPGASRTVGGAPQAQSTTRPTLGAVTSGHTPTAVVIWLGGNDAYPRNPPVSEGLSQNLEGRIERMVASLRAQYEVYIVGPTPRPRVDGQSVWEDTQVWKLERHFAEMLREQGDVSSGRKLGKLVAVGRRLCTRQRGAVMHQGKPRDVYRVDKGDVQN
ncbi:hypothetical protein FJT64_023244 [Amphibalanus amphitrite]|uniref:Uncharacterized protein n=1 Tax=Amphibalanus amphitrite TaxID=1232801 RepID=A0A6A4WBD3_AMPAM|nr:hypothetical protein FJT64_023244 [Amphibalanus amphitrite]